LEKSKGCENVGVLDIGGRNDIKMNLEEILCEDLVDSSGSGYGPVMDCLNTIIYLRGFFGGEGEDFSYFTGLSSNALKYLNETPVPVPRPIAG
jgi:hypothetical protein